jgi:hypothetical protein
MSNVTHPGRSLDFLSRLHDEELSPADRAHFESHRAHCAECRRAAAEFEATLAFYRTAGTSPAPSDLAARILRRLEASNPRRSPFGVVFGIDVKWAGAFTAALIAVILGYSLLDREEQTHRIPVSFVGPTPGAAAALRAVSPTLSSKSESGAKETRPRARREPKPEAGAKGTAPLLTASTAQAVGKPEEKAAAASSVPAPATDQIGPSPTALRVAAEIASTREKPVGSLAKAPVEAGPSADARGLPSTSPAPIRITVTALDAEGAAPAVLNSAQLSLRPEDRGQYVLVVGADGVPTEVAMSEPTRKRGDAFLEKSPSPSLRKLRFQAGARPRRLLVRVE